MTRKEVMKIAFTNQKKVTVEELSTVYTEDFLITNLKTHEVLGRGLEDLKQMADEELEMGTKLEIIETRSEGDFEVFTYKWTDKSGQGTCMALFRFRDLRISELILLNHD